MAHKKEYESFDSKHQVDAGSLKAEMKKPEDGEVFGIKDFLLLEEYDKTVMASLIVSAKVMGEDRLEVTWKHQDVYEKILSEIQG